MKTHFEGIVPRLTRVSLSCHPTDRLHEFRMCFLPRSRALLQTVFRTAAPLVVLFLALSMVACENDAIRQGTGSEQEQASTATSDSLGSVADLLTADPRFSTLVTALDSAGLMQDLRHEGPFTLFAPTDTAFSQLPQGTMEDLLQPANRNRLVAILSYHIVEGTHRATDLQKVTSLSTIAGSNLPVGNTNRAVTVGTATVIQPNREAGNGMIHVLDAVLMPPSGETT